MEYFHFNQSRNEKPNNYAPENERNFWFDVHSKLS